MLPSRPPDPEARQRRRKQITPHSPWRNGTAERWAKTGRHDLLDHVIVGPHHRYEWRKAA